jgi:hypothetical protein
MIKKDDEPRVYQAIKKLAVCGIAIDPNDIQFEISHLDNNGKKRILKKELSPSFIEKLEKIRDEFSKKLKDDKWSGSFNAGSHTSEQSESSCNSGTEQSGLVNGAPRLY